MPEKRMDASQKAKIGEKRVQEEGLEKERKVRSDKGLILATQRDLYCLAWIAEQYAARGDQVRRLLTRFPDPKRPFKGALIGETTTKDQIARWRRAGWIEHQRVLADEPGWCWVTKKGLEMVDLADIYTARVPAPTRLVHIYAVNEVRFALEDQYAWKSERRYRADELSQIQALKKDRGRKGQSLGAIPDGVVTTRDGVVAVEVELTAKKSVDLVEKLRRLLRQVQIHTTFYEKAFPKIWFFVPTSAMADVVEDAIGMFPESDQDRIEWEVVEDLLPTKYRR
jgi:hypothetical protein